MNEYLFIFFEYLVQFIQPLQHIATQTTFILLQTTTTTAKVRDLTHGN